MPDENFINLEGQITRWPKKNSDKQTCLAALAEHFEFDQKYSESDVNTIILQYTVNMDHALLRRELCVRGFFARTNDGSKYWRLMSVGAI